MTQTFDCITAVVGRGEKSLRNGPGLFSYISSGERERKSAKMMDKMSSRNKMK